MVNKVLVFFDKLEDKTRAKLSRMPMLYALFGGIGIVLFWRGVWHTADTVYLVTREGFYGFDFIMALDGIMSFLIGTLILLVTGVFVTSFIGNRIIISGLSGEKKLTELTIEEIETEEDKINKIQKTLNKVEEKIESIEQDLQKK